VEPSIKPKSKPSRYLPVALRERPFALLFAGETVSSLGNWMFVVALPFAALELHATPGQLGLVLAARHVPFALFALVAGAWADRFERRRLMLVTQVVQGACQALMATLLLTDSAQLWHLAAIVAVYGAADAFFYPALIGLVPAAAGAERAQEANALMRISAHTTQLAGAPLGGALVAAFGAGQAIAIDAATFAFSALALARMPRLQTAREHAHEKTLRAIATGARAVRERPWVLRFLAVLSVYHLTVLPCVFVLGPLIAQRELDGATSWGIIQGAFAAGAVAGGVLAIRWRPHRPMRIMGLAFVVAALQSTVIALGHTTAGIAVFQGLAAIGVSFGWTMWESTIQRRVPEHLVSRVISFDFLTSTGTLPLGMALVAPIAESAGLRPTMIVASALCATLALAYALTTDSEFPRRQTPSRGAGRRPEA
jgi:MFS family permease